MQANGLKIVRMVRPLIPEVLVRPWRQYKLRQFAANCGLQLVEHDLFYDLKRADTILRIQSAHSVYLRHMMENFDYYVDSVIPVHVDVTRLVDMSGPRYHRLQGFADIPFLFPSHTEPYNTTVEYLDFAGLHAGQIVLDVGAYSGVTSIIFAQLVGLGGHVYAFEADPANYECAAINIEMAAKVMGLNNITLLNTAIWSHNEGILFSQEGAMGSSAVAVTGGRRGLERVVPSVRLQDFFAKYGLARADFVKIDIEGCEIEVLQCSAKFLKDTGARLIVEPHFVNGTMSRDRCCDLLESAGYRVNLRGKVGESEGLIEAIP